VYVLTYSLRILVFCWLCETVFLCYTVLAIFSTTFVRYIFRSVRNLICARDARLKRYRSSRKVGIESFDLNEIEMTRQVPVKFFNIKFSGFRIVFCVQMDGWMERTILLGTTQTSTVPPKIGPWNKASRKIQRLWNFDKCCDWNEDGKQPVVNVVNTENKHN
jgi:hypothetical protein